MQDEDIDFIIGKFRDGAFSTDSNWRRFKSTVGLRSMRIGVAAAVSAIVVVSAAAAAVYTYRHHTASIVETKTSIEMTVEGEPLEGRSKPMVFEASRLSKVVETVESEYGVKISNVPSNADDYVLTLRYEGTPEELIDAINEILGTSLTVEEI